MDVGFTPAGLYRTVAVQNIFRLFVGESAGRAGEDGCADKGCGNSNRLFMMISLQSSSVK